MLGRISEIARAANVPLAGERCRPNLFIFVTAQPTQLLQAMDKQKRGVTFGDASPTVVDEFINTPRPVRVWYDTSIRTPEGTPPKQGLPNAAQVLGGGLQGVKVYNDNDRTSHMLLSKTWSFSYVYVVVDQARLQAVARGQLADYVALVGLAQIKPEAHLDDQSFLKSLYTTEQISKAQRTHIANSIVRDVVQR